MAIISVRVSSDIPIQSDYMPLITLYFFLSILYTFSSFLWFVIAEHLKSNKIRIKFIVDLKKKFRSNKSSNETNNLDINNTNDVLTSVYFINHFINNK